MQTEPAAVQCIPDGGMDAEMELMHLDVATFGTDAAVTGVTSSTI